MLYKVYALLIIHKFPVEFSLLMSLLHLYIITFIKKTHVERFFQFLMLNISSIKELLHKPSEIQWNITGTLPEKLKSKIYLALSY